MSVKYFEKPQLIAFACDAKRFAIVFLFFFFFSFSSMFLKGKTEVIFIFFSDYCFKNV